MAVIGYHERRIYLIVSILVALAVLLHFYTRQSPSNAKTLAVPLTLFLFAAILFFLSWKADPLARSLTLALTSVVFALSLVEMTLQAAGYYPSAPMPSVLSRRINKIAELRAKGWPAYPSIPADGLLAKPFNSQGDTFLSNIGDSYSVGGEEDEGVVAYRTDENGFRNPLGFYSSHESFDLLFLGDSFAEGAGVQDGHTIEDFVRERTGHNVYNAGKGGTGLLHHWATFLEYGLRKRPKRVVLIATEAVWLNRAMDKRYGRLLDYVENPISKDIIERNQIKDELLKEWVGEECEEYFRLSASLLKNGSGPWETLRTVVNELKAKSKVAYLYTGLVYPESRQYNGEGIPNCANLENSRQLSGAILKLFQKTVSSYGGDFYLVFLPDTRYFVRNWPDCEYQMILRQTEELNVRLIDLRLAFDRSQDPRKYFGTNLTSPTVIRMRKAMR